MFTPAPHAHAPGWHRYFLTDCLAVEPQESEPYRARRTQGHRPRRRYLKSKSKATSPRDGTPRANIQLKTEGADEYVTPAKREGGCVCHCVGVPLCGCFYHMFIFYIYWGHDVVYSLFM